jgi:ATP-dependent RNA helicase DeaD
VNDHRATAAAASSPSDDPSDFDLSTTFDALDLSPEVRRAVDELGFLHPTPVQVEVFSPASEGLDMVVQARTGTGKTAAFGLPLVDSLVDPEQHEVQALVLSPTRELALQIHRELESLGRYRGIKGAAIYGGAPMQPQIDAIRGGAQVLAATPGRVLDHLERRTLNPRSIRVLVLDESDEMLSMGFLPQITRIMQSLPGGHQTLLFSATLPPDVRRIAETRLVEPRFVTLSGDHIGALSIQHFAYRSRGRKADELVQIIEAENPESAIVFCNTRDQTKRIAHGLQKAGFSADWLNADLAQSDREKVMRATREGRLRFLVATDVAARGIDISHLTHVINADFPESTENYVHRTGRTGRAGRTGTAISLIGPRDIGNLYMLRLTYKIFPVERELPTARELQSRKEADLLRFLVDGFAGTPQGPDELGLARRILSSESAELVLAGLLRDHFGARPGATDEASARRRAPALRPADAEKRPDPRRARDGAGRGRSAEDDALRGERRSRGDAPRDRGPDRGERRERRPRTSDEEPRRAAAPREDGLEVVSAASLLGGSPLDLLDQGAEHESAAPQPEAREALPLEQPRAPERSAEAAPAASAPSPSPEDADVGRVFVSAGRRDGVSAAEVRAVLEGAGIHPDDVLSVEVQGGNTFVGVVGDLLAEALAALDGARLGTTVARAERARPRARA